MKPRRKERRPPPPGPNRWSRPGLFVAPGNVQGQSTACVGRVVDDVDEALTPWDSRSGVHVKGFAGQLHEAVHQGGAATGRAGVEGMVEPGRWISLPAGSNFRHPHVDDIRQAAAGMVWESRP